MVRCSSSSSSCFFTELSCCTDSVARSTAQGFRISLPESLAPGTASSSTDLAGQVARPFFRCCSTAFSKPVQWHHNMPLSGSSAAWYVHRDVGLPGQPIAENIPRSSKRSHWSFRCCHRNIGSQETGKPPSRSPPQPPRRSPTSLEHFPFSLLQDRACMAQKLRPGRASVNRLWISFHDSSSSSFSFIRRLSSSAANVALLASTWILWPSLIPE